MPPVLPKRCPNCATRCEKTGENLAYWKCPSCGWTDDPSVLQPLAAPTPLTTEAVDPAPAAQ